MVADLTGKVPPGTRRIRIWTNLKIYWDQVLIDTTPDGAIPVTRTKVPLRRGHAFAPRLPARILGTPAADISTTSTSSARQAPTRGTAASTRSSAT